MLPCRDERLRGGTRQGQWVTEGGPGEMEGRCTKQRVGDVGMVRRQNDAAARLRLVVEEHCRGSGCI